MTFPGLVAANNLSDVVDRERAWDNLGLNISVTWEKLQNLDPDASAYIDAVALIENGYTEPGVQKAINDFIVGCKTDGIWTAIKASCILAGAHTLAGALVPLAGAAPTNFNFVSGDYSRKNGLAGNGTTKYLNSNRAENQETGSNAHVSVFVTTPESRTGVNSDHLGVFNSDGRGTAIAQRADNTTYSYVQSDYSFSTSVRASTNSLYGAKRSQVGNPIVLRIAKNNYSQNVQTGVFISPSSFNYFVFAANNNGTAGLFAASRLAFYSIGESLDLALLDARITTLITAFGGAIP